MLRRPRESTLEATRRQGVSIESASTRLPLGPRVASRYSVAQPEVVVPSDAQQQLLQDWSLWQRGRGMSDKTISDIGKGHKQRQIPLHPGLKDLAAIMPWRDWWFPTYVGNTEHLAGGPMLGNSVSSAWARGCSERFSTAAASLKT